MITSFNKNSKKLSVLGLMVMLLISGCASTESNNDQQVETANSQTWLSAQEERAYILFQKDLNEQHLNGLDPISIAKLYVQAKLDSKYDIAYALYTDKEGSVQWSKEEDEQIPNSHRGTKEQILKTYEGIESGDFVQINDYEGYIEFQSSLDSKSGFQMIRDDDGIWNVSFQPIQ